MTVELEVGGRTRQVDVVAVPCGWSLLLDGRSYEVALDAPHGQPTLSVNGQSMPITLPGARRFGRGGAAGDSGASGPRRVVAPMPGRIVKLLVKPGDVVAARQGLVVVEAMKMENELRAPGAGTVAEVRVVEGASVEANAVLIVIE